MLDFRLNGIRQEYRERTLVAQPQNLVHCRVFRPARAVEDIGIDEVVAVTRIEHGKPP